MFSLLQNLKIPYVPLTETQSKTEESIFKATSILLINETRKRNKCNQKSKAISPTDITIYKKHTNPPIEINISIPLTLHNTLLLYYPEFKNWFVKRNFKYTFYKCTPYSPTNFYIDSIHINNFYTSNDITEAPINNIVFTHPLLNFSPRPPKGPADVSGFSLENPDKVLPPESSPSPTGVGPAFWMLNHLIKPILYYFSQLFYSKTKKIYIAIQFIVREP